MLITSIITDKLDNNKSYYQLIITVTISEKNEQISWRRAFDIHRDII